MRNYIMIKKRNWTFKKESIMKNANYTNVRSVFAKFAVMTVAPLLVSGALIGITGCAVDDSASPTATIDDENDAVAIIPAPKEYSEEPTIEMTGKTSFDIVGFNEQLDDTPSGTHLYARTAAQGISDKFLGNSPYKKYAEKILGYGEKMLDKALDKVSDGVWSGVKDAFLFLVFPDQKKEEFNISGAFDKVNEQLANMEAILQEMRIEVENGMKVQTYAQRLTDRRDLYSVLKNGIEELNNRIILINNDNVNYPTEEKKYAALKDAVRQWGEESVGTATAVMPARQQAKNLIEKITSSVLLPDDGAYVSDYLSIYDEYANRTLVWEQDGYAWRELMRAQDAKMVLQLVVASSLYYTLVNENPLEIEKLKQQVSDYFELVKNTPVVRHSTPIYIKYGSKWAGQAFTGELKDINYTNVLKDKKWSAGAARGAKAADRKYGLNENGFRYNASRLYGGYGPAKSDNLTDDYEPSTKFAMPEEWYKELYNAYASNGERRSLMEIFKREGFTYGSKPLELKQFDSNKCEQFFITSRRSYTRTFGIDKDQYYLGISVVAGNSDTDIYTGTVRDHEAYALRFQASAVDKATKTGRKMMHDNKTDEYRMYNKLVSDYSSYRSFFFPVKAAAPLVVK